MFAKLPTSINDGNLSKLIYTWFIRWFTDKKLGILNSYLCEMAPSNADYADYADLTIGCLLFLFSLAIFVFVTVQLNRSQ